VETRCTCRNDMQVNVCVDTAPVAAPRRWMGKRSGQNGSEQERKRRGVPSVTLLRRVASKRAAVLAKPSGRMGDDPLCATERGDVAWKVEGRGEGLLVGRDEGSSCLGRERGSEAAASNSDRVCGRDNSISTSGNPPSNVGRSCRGWPVGFSRAESQDQVANLMQPARGLGSTSNGQRPRCSISMSRETEGSRSGAALRAGYGSVWQGAGSWLAGRVWWAAACVWKLGRPFWR
jgi:hypothetical protein